MNDAQRDEKITETHTAVIGIVEKLAEVRCTIYGNGHPGMKTDVDRLKMYCKFQCWFLGVVAIASIGVVARLVYNHIIT